MKLAIPVYNNNVSNVFDFAHRLLLVEIENGKETNRSEVALESQLLPQRADKLKSLGASVLVCGAISQALANMVTASGIQVLPYVTGRIDDVLSAYITGQLVKPEFTMPGCWPGARRGFGRRRRGFRRQGGRGKF
ncbi:MAG: NifB/NifX family molybdenum-iron cluster-binding protein [Sedimentisphaerales bacterium]|nr:NifB/NifX family molybdenum-iron cluster-binding protein [Sedimentisphaerales bacterium]